MEQPFRRAMWLVAALLGTTGAAPVDAPPLTPGRDAQVSYQAVVNGQAAPDAVTLQVSGASHLVRVTSPKLAGYLLVAPLASRLTVVLPAQKAYMELPLGENTERFMLLNANMHFVRGGGATVAGQPCTQWTVVSAQGQGNACVTSDGLVLEASGNLGGDPSNKVEAVAVQYGAQPTALFTVPHGYRLISPPSKPAQ